MNPVTEQNTSHIEEESLLTRVIKGRNLGTKFRRNMEYATPEDALALGLEESDYDKIMICDRLGNLAMFHFIDISEEIQAEQEGTEESTQTNEDITEEANDEIIEEVAKGKELKPSKSWGDIAESNAEAKRLAREKVRLETARVRARVSAVRGWIMRTDTVTGERKLICKSFGSTSIVHLNPSQLSNYRDAGYVFRLFIEGSTLRLFWLSEPTKDENGKITDEHTGRWIHSSYRKIDSTNSRIPGIELGFRQMFDEASPDFDYSQLNKDYIYVFQVMHRDNQIMNQDVIEKPILYHTATITGPNCLEPLLLLSLTSDEPGVKVKGTETVMEIPFTAATESLQVRKCLMACRGYEIVQLAPKSIEKLMKVRGYQAMDSAPYIPIELMYLRLESVDRHLLVQALPPHQKALGAPEVMDKYIAENSDKLAGFCAEILLAKISGNRISFSKTLKWLINQVHLEDRTSNHRFVKNEYLGIVHQMGLFNGESLYRCFRDMEIAMKNIEKKSLMTGLYESHPEEFFPDRPFVPPQLPKPRNNGRKSTNNKASNNKASNNKASNNKASNNKASNGKTGGQNKQGQNGRGKNPRKSSGEATSNNNDNNKKPRAPRNNNTTTNSNGNGGNSKNGNTKRKDNLGKVLPVKAPPTQNPIATSVGNVDDFFNKISSRNK